MDTIKNINLLSKLQGKAKSLVLQIERLENDGGVIHPIEADIMREKTRAIYELLLELHEDKSVSNVSFMAANIPPLEIETAQPETAFERETPVMDVFDWVEKEDADEPDSFEIYSSEPVEMTETGPNAIPDRVEDVESGDNVLEEKHLYSKQVDEPKRFSFQKESSGSTFDLFGESEIVADKLSSPDKSVASRIEKSKIQDLRQAIGINDKFLLINELFEGNISYYNKAIDELNSFQSLNGAKTYLIELSVQHQWLVESAAVEKINLLVERKFNA